MPILNINDAFIICGVISIYLFGEVCIEVDHKNGLGRLF